MSQFIINPHRFTPAPAMASVTMTDSFNSSTAWTSTRTFPALGIGAAAADRVVAVALNIRSNSPQTGMTATIGGVPATVVIGTDTDPVTNFHSAVVHAAVPTGATADLVLTLNADAGGNRVMAGSVHRIVGVSATAKAGGTANGATTLSVTLGSSPGGVVVAAAMSGTAGPDCAWAPPMTEATDVNVAGGGNDTSSTATGLTSGSSVSPQVTFASASPPYCTLAAVTFGP